MGKAAARREASARASGALVADDARSLRPDEAAGSLLIEGENLAVLRHLRRTHRGRVKLVYIDPPFNTGNEFVYRDRFAGGGAPDAHSRWLCMMYPRLAVARDLMRDDGVIFVSIGDREVHNLRHLLDEVFGEDAFVAHICHKARASVSNDKLLSASHHHVLVYARSPATLHAVRGRFGLAPDLSGYDRRDGRGPYKLVPVDGPGGARKGNPRYTFLGVTGYFRYSEATMARLHAEGRIVRTRAGLQQKRYLDEARSARRTDTTWWDHGFYTSTATSRLRDLLGGIYFEGPKPVPLIRRMLELQAREEGDVVLDFFAGSGTTAEAVVEQEAADGVRRSFVLVQAAEPTPPRSEARKAGYETVADIMVERVRRVLERRGRGGFRVMRYEG